MVRAFKWTRSDESRDHWPRWLEYDGSQELRQTKDEAEAATCPGRGPSRDKASCASQG